MPFYKTNPLALFCSKGLGDDLIRCTVSFLVSRLFLSLSFELICLPGMSDLSEFTVASITFAGSISCILMLSCTLSFFYECVLSCEDLCFTRISLPLLLLFDASLSWLGLYVNRVQVQNLSEIKCASKRALTDLCIWTYLLSGGCEPACISSFLGGLLFCYELP